MAKEKAVKIFQQGELNAVVMYRDLASRMKTEEDKKLLTEIAADEGRHAGILRKITNLDLQPKSGLKYLVLPVYKLCGRKVLYTIVGISEKAAGGVYRILFKAYPETRQIAADEKRHGNLLKAAKKTKK